MTEDGHAEVVHDPRGQATGDPDLAPLRAGRHHHREEVEGGDEEDEAEVVMPVGHAVVDRDARQFGPELGGHGDDADQDNGQHQHAGVLLEETAQAELLLLVLCRLMGERDVGFTALGFIGQQLIDPSLELVGDPTEGQSGLCRPRLATAAHRCATHATEPHYRVPFIVPLPSVRAPSATAPSPASSSSSSSAAWARTSEYNGVDASSSACVPSATIRP